MVTSMRRSVIALYILQMIAGALSFLASSTIAFMILRSEPKLGKPFRRLIFSLSISDMIQSLGFTIGPICSYASKYSEYKFHWEIGNQTSCDVQGIMVIFGGTMCAFYTLSLCMFYLSMVKFNMSDEQFCKRVERKLLVLALIHAVTSSIVYLWEGMYNSLPDGNMCFVIETPNGCHTNPDVECERGENATRLVLYLTFIPLGLVCMGIAYSLSSLYLHVRKERINQQKRFMSGFSRASLVQRNNPEVQNEDQGQNCEQRLSIVTKVVNSLSRASFRSNVTAPNGRPALAGFMTIGERKARERQRQTLLQAILYVGAYTFVYMWAFVLYFFHREGINPPLPLAMISHFIFPLQGVINIFIYTRSKVLSLKERCPEFSRCRCIWEVVKGGGDIPAEYQNIRPPRPQRSSGRGSVTRESMARRSRRRSLNEGSQRWPTLRGARDDPVLPKSLSSLLAKPRSTSGNSSGLGHCPQSTLNGDQSKVVVPLSIEDDCT